VQRFNFSIVNAHLLGGALSALLFLLLRPFISDFSSFVAQVPLFYIALQVEVLLIWMPVALAGLIVLIGGGVPEGLAYFLFVVMPVVLLSRQALLHREDKKGNEKWYPAGRLLAVLLLLGFAYVVLFSWLEDRAQLTQQIQQAFQTMKAQAPTNKSLQSEQLEGFMIKLVPYFPGISTVAILMMTIGAGALTQRQLIKNSRLIRPPLSLVDVYLPWWCWYTLIITSLGWMFLPAGASYTHLTANLSLVLLFGFLMQGLGIVHAYVKKLRNPQLFLVIFYFLMIMFTWPIFIFTVLGILEPWVQLRERFRSNKE